MKGALKKVETSRGERIKSYLLRYGPKSVLLITLLLAGHWAWQQTAQLLPVEQIVVTGVMQQVSGAELRELVHPMVTDGFFRTDLIAVRDAIQAMPWVSKATVRRQWPDALAIEIEEQQLLASWGESALVNAQGELFYPESVEVAAGMPTFVGIDGLSQKMSQRYRDFQALLQPEGLMIVSLEVTERRAWQMTLSNGIELLLGREPQEKDLQRFMTAYRSGLSQRAEEISRVDLRYSNGFAIRWKENGIG